MEKVFITDKQGNKVLPKTHVSAVYDDEGNDLGSHLGAFEDEVRGLVGTPHQEYVTVSTYASLPQEGSADTIYRVSNYDGSQSQVAADVYSEYAWDGTQYVFLCVKSAVGEVFDISTYHNNAKYADLKAALTSNTGGVPQSLQKGGMSVKFVQSSDNKYVQFRCMTDEFTTDVTQWQGVDDEPIAGSDNLVKSGGISNFIQNLDGCFSVKKIFPSGESFPFGDIYLRRGEKVKLSVLATVTPTTSNYFSFMKKGIYSYLINLDVNSNVEKTGEYIVTEDDYYTIRSNVNESIEFDLNFRCDSKTQDGLNINEIYNVIAEENFPVGNASHTERIAIKPSSDLYIETNGINEKNKKYTIYWFNASNDNITSTDITKDGILHVVLPQDAYLYQIYKINQTETSNVNIKIHRSDIIAGIRSDIQDIEEETDEISDEISGKIVTVPEGTPTTIYPYFPLAKGTRKLYFKISTIAGCSRIVIYLDRAPSSIIKYIDVYASDVNQWIEAETNENINGIGVQMVGSSPNEDINILYGIDGSVLPYLYTINQYLYKGADLSLNSKKAAFCGDSIMKADSDRANLGGWAEIIGEKNHMIYQNFGVSGATIGRSSQTSRACIQDQVTALDSSWDYIIIQGGCNDTDVNTPLGEITEGYDAVFNTSTLYGGLEYLCKYLMENFPTKKYGFIITYRFGTLDIQTMLQTQMNAIKEVCDKWGCPYIDLRKEAGFNLICEDLRVIYGVPIASIPLYSTTAGYALDEKVKRIVDGTYITYKANEAITAPAGEFDASKWTQISDGGDYDSWHANRVAYEQSAQKVQSWMMSL